MGSTCYLELDPECGSKRGQVRVGGGTVEPVQHGDHPRRRPVVRFDRVEFAQLGGDLRSQSVLDGPPDRRIAGRESPFMRRPTSCLPLGSWPEPRYPLDEVLAQEIDLTVRHSQHDPVPVDRRRQLGLSTFAKIEEIGPDRLVADAGIRVEDQQESQRGHVSEPSDGFHGCHASPPPCDDRPDRLDGVAPHGVDAVIKIDGRITMSDEEFESVAKLGQCRAGLGRDDAELVAAKLVIQALPVLGQRFAARVGRERLDPGIDGHSTGVARTDDRGQHRQAVREVVILGVSITAADGTVAVVHEDVRAGLELDPAGQLAVDVVRARAAAGKDRRVQPLRLEKVAGLDRPVHHLP